MIVDTSAIMAIVLREPEKDLFLNKIVGAEICRISVGTWMEINVVVQRRHPARAAAVDALLQASSFIFEAVSLEQAQIGREGYRKFGQASGHPARLNFGDCFAYALAKSTGEPLLFKGDDFSRTDVPAA